MIPASVNQVPDLARSGARHECNDERRSHDAKQDVCLPHVVTLDDRPA